MLDSRTTSVSRFPRFSGVEYPIYTPTFSVGVYVGSHDGYFDSVSQRVTYRTFVATTVSGAT